MDNFKEMNGVSTTNDNACKSDPQILQDKFSAKHDRPNASDLCESESRKAMDDNMPNNVINLINCIEDEINDTGSDKHSNNVKIEIVSEKLTELMTCLLEKSWQDAPNDDCLKVFLEHDVLNEVYNWIASNKELMKGMTRELLQLYNNILSIGSDSFVRNTEFVEPLLLLLLALRPNEKKRMPHEMELSYVQILSSLSGRLIDEQFLQKFQNVHISKQGYKLPRYAFINLLMFYIHEDGPVGNYARDTLIVCTEISISNNDFGEFIAKESDCCNILAAGLIGLYSALPTTLDITNEDWYCITKDMVSNSKEIHGFVRALKFCCEVIKYGHPAVQERLLSLIHDGFLSSVLAAALHQPITEAIIAAVAYLELFLREVTEIRFMRVVLKFLLTDDYDGRLIIDTLVDLISSRSPQLCMVTLQLFKTLMDLNCEDIVFHLMIRYLIPCTHLLPNQKRTIKELDFYCKSATMFLYLTPSCCLESSLPANEIGDGETGQGSSEGKDQSTTRTDSKHAKWIVRKSFTKCLDDARVTVRDCKRACQCWSAVYDGTDVMTEFPRRSGSSVLLSQSQSDRRNSEVFSFALRRNSSITESDKRDEKLKLAKTMSQPMHQKITNGYSDAIEEDGNLSATDRLGPFITKLYEKLEEMAENSFYINLQLTALISRISCYPQPLLRSLLLNSNLIMQPGIKSLFQIVTRISHSTDIFISQLDDFECLMNRARSNLLKREKKLYGTTKDAARKDSNASSMSVTIDSKDDGLFAESASEQISRNINTSHAFKGAIVPPGARKDSLYSEPSLDMSPYNTGATIGRLHPAMRSPTKRTSEPLMRGETANLKKKNPTAIKNAIYCALILEEWLKELAAISLEHNLV